MRTHVAIHPSIHPSIHLLVRARVRGLVVAVSVWMCVCALMIRLAAAAADASRLTRQVCRDRTSCTPTYRCTDIVTCPRHLFGLATVPGWLAGAATCLGPWACCGGLTRSPRASRHPGWSGLVWSGLVSSHLSPCSFVFPFCAWPLPHQARRKPPTRGRRRDIPGACSSPSPHASSSIRTERL